MQNNNPLQLQLQAYKSKFYKNLLLRGLILTIGLLISAYLVANVAEYFGNFNTTIRGLLLFSFLALAALSFAFWIVAPVLKLFHLNQPLSDEAAALQIGKYFPEINDKLLNVLQLDKLNANESDLIAASIAQKSKNLNVINFPDAVQYDENRKYLKYTLPPLLLFLLLFLFSPNLFSESTSRIIKYGEKFEAKALFRFVVKNEKLSVFKNEDFTVLLAAEGQAVPEQAFILTDNGRKIKMEKTTNGSFSFNLKKVQKNIRFSFEAAGFSSADYELQVIQRPSLSNFSVALSYPAYVGKKDEKLLNTGNLLVPEGTTIKWIFNTQETESVAIAFENEQQKASNKGNNTFEFAKRALKPSNYKVGLQNKFSDNKESIEYFLNVIPDEFPTVTLKQYEDTTLYNYLVLGGNIGDDYGIKKLEMKYRVVKQGENAAEKPYLTMPLNHNANTINQSYFHQWDLQQLNLQQGDRLEYFVQVWDNDGIHNSKSAKTGSYEFKLPTKEEFKKELQAASSNTESQMDKTLKKVQEFKKELEDAKDKITGKKKLAWQDKQALENLLKKREEIMKDVQKMQEQNKMLNEKQDRFGQKDEAIAEKAKQLQEMMDELLDDETKKLYDELQKMLQQEHQNLNMQELLEDIEKKEKNLEQELDRALEMFKKLELDRKIGDQVEDLKELANKQEELAKESQEAKKEESEKLAEKQEELNKELEKEKEDLKEIEKMNEELGKQKDFDQAKEEQKQAEEQQKESKKQLDQKQNKEAAKNQKQAAQKMRKAAEKMEQQQQSGEQQQQVEDYNALRQILENLVKLSFDQEELMKQFKGVRPEDPRTIALSQQQLKLKDDAKIVEDSLIALSKRVFQIKSFVTREVSSMNDYIIKSLDEIKKRNFPKASSEQQLTMTSINNLALMLDDVLHQMQQNMGNQMGGMQLINKKRGEKSMGESQQKLNQKMMDLMKSGKSGKELSQELGKLAAEQEMIRRAMKNAMGKQKAKGEKGKEDGGKQGSDGNISKMMEEMEKTEEDLVNKRLTQETMRRQKEILTRLLESEKAMREREQDEKREAERAKEKPRQNPSEFSEYLKMKEKQVEILKSIPASLNPYYKKEVNEYFKKINQEDK